MDIMASRDKVCSELVGTGDVDRDVCAGLRAGDSSHGGFGETLGLEGAINGLFGGGRRGWWCVAECPCLFCGNCSLERLRGGLVGMGWCGRGGVR